MKWVSSAFHSDRISLSWRDLLLLALGRTIRDGACLIRLGRLPEQR